MSGLNTKTNELIKECEKMLKVGCNPQKYIKLAWCSFSGDFNYFSKFIIDNIDEIDFEKFEKTCDNRIERAKTFLQDVGTVLGFFVTSLTIVLAVSTMERGKTPTDPILNFIITNKYGILFFPILIGLLLTGVIILALLLGHYRTHIHAWTAFKEGAILNKNRAIVPLMLMLTSALSEM
jgi:hypothetical protein